MNVNCCRSPKLTEKPENSSPFERLCSTSGIVDVPCFFLNPTESQGKDEVKSKRGSNHSKSENDGFRVVTCGVGGIVSGKLMNLLWFCFRDEITSYKGKYDWKSHDEDDRIDWKAELE